MSGITIFWGTLLRQLREKHKFKQAEIASILHIDRASYSNIETGRKRPSAETLAILSNIYDIDLFQYALNNMPETFVREQSEFKAERIAKKKRKKERPAESGPHQSSLSFYNPDNPEDLDDSEDSEDSKKN